MYSKNKRILLYKMTYHRYDKTTDPSMEEIVRLDKDELQEIIECLNKDIDIEEKTLKKL